MTIEMACLVLILLLSFDVALEEGCLYLEALAVAWAVVKLLAAPSVARSPQE